MYKAKSHMKKNFTLVSYDLLPLRDFCRTVFGEEVPSFQEKLRQNKPDDPVWNTCNGISNTRGVTDDAHFPILFTTGFYDIYTGGIFSMWRQMNAENKARSAMIVSPYDHGDRCNNETSMAFEKGKRTEQFGEEYEIDWLDSIRDPRKAPPVPAGKITYYRLFENKWQSDDFMPGEKQITLPLGDHAETYTYNPFDAPSFQGGLCSSFGGCMFQNPPNQRHDIVTVYSAPFAQDTFVKGKMAASLKVASDCEDTCFYMRLSITTNLYSPPVRPIDGLAEVIRAAGGVSAMYYGWEPLREICRPRSMKYATFINDYMEESTDTCLTDEALERIEKSHPDFVFLYMVETDEKGGHDNGWMSEEYLRRVYIGIENAKRVYEACGDEYTIAKIMGVNIPREWEGKALV